MKPKALLKLIIKVILAIFMLYFIAILGILISESLLFIKNMDKELREIIFKSIIFIIHIAVVRIYLWYIKKEYGKQSSISRAVKKLKEDGLIILAFLFIWIGMCPIAYIAQSWPIIFATMLLFGISIITGYNPNLKGIKIQDNLHVAFATIPIILFTLDILLNIIHHWPGHLWISLIYIITTSLVLLYTAYVLVMRRPYRTWNLENAFLWLLHFYAPFQYILIDLILKYK